MVVGAVAVVDVGDDCAGGKVDSLGGPCLGDGVKGPGVALNSGVRGITCTGPPGPLSEDGPAAGADMIEPDGVIVAAGEVPGTPPSKPQDTTSPTIASSVTNTAVP